MSEGVSLPLRLPLPLPLPFPLPLPCPLEGLQSNWVGEVGVIIKERGAKRAWGVRLLGGLGSEARFQVKKSACFWCHGRYRE